MTQPLNEDNDLLCRQLLRIVAQVRAGAHVESSNVSVARAGTLTIYTVQVSLEEPPAKWDLRLDDGSSAIERGVDYLRERIGKESQ